MVSATQLRQWHAYTGLFIAPSVLFFALTGAVQLFNLHEAHGSYKPAAVLENLSAVHKDQVFKPPSEHAADKDADSADRPAGEDEDEPGAATRALKWFFLAVSLGLILSTMVGVWMGLTQIRRRRLGWFLLVAGALIPICLLAI